MSSAKLPGLHLPSLTGLRFFAALLVFGRHIAGAGPLDGEHNLFSPGTIGVSFFFVLSGFILTWTARPGDTRRAFWQRRFARVYPAYVAAWAIALALLVVTHKGVRWADIFALTLLQGWFPSDSVHFAAATVFWSLSAEAFFYAIFPWLHRQLERLAVSSLRVAAVALAASTVLLATIGHPVITGSLTDWALFIFPPTRALEFAFGITLAVLVQRERMPQLRLDGMIVLTVAAYVVTIFAPDAFRRVAVTIVPFGLLIVAAAQADTAGRWSPFRGAVLQHLGRWSYSFYLLHTLVITVVFSVVNHVLGVASDNDLSGAATAVTVLAALVAAIASSAVLHLVVEAPFERRLRPTARQAELAP